MPEALDSLCNTACVNFSSSGGEGLNPEQCHYRLFLETKPFRTCKAKGGEGLNPETGKCQFSKKQSSVNGLSDGEMPMWK